MKSSATSHTIAMHDARAALAEADVRFQQLTNFQLKAGPFSYYPGKGTIYRDGDMSVRPEKGIAAFIELLRKAGLVGAGSKVRHIYLPEA